MSFGTTPLGGTTGKREPQIILKTDERNIVLELGLGGKFSAKSRGCDENRIFLEGDTLEIAAKNGRRVITHLPAKPVKPKLVLHLLARRRVTLSRRRATSLRDAVTSGRGRQWYRR
jgi:hypothetical protein